MGVLKWIYLQCYEFNLIFMHNDEKWLNIFKKIWCLKTARFSNMSDHFLPLCMRVLNHHWGSEAINQMRERSSAGGEQTFKSFRFEYVISFSSV